MWTIVIFLSDVWTLILTAPIHCISDVMLHFSASVWKKKQTHLHLGCPERTFSADFHFCVNYSFNNKICSKNFYNQTVMVSDFVKNSLHYFFINFHWGKVLNSKKNYRKKYENVFIVHWIVSFQNRKMRLKNVTRAEKPRKDQRYIPKQSWCCECLKNCILIVLR